MGGMEIASSSFPRSIEVALPAAELIIPQAPACLTAVTDVELAQLLVPDRIERLMGLIWTAEARFESVADVLAEIQSMSALLQETYASSPQFLLCPVIDFAAEEAMGALRLLESRDPMQCGRSFVSAMRHVSRVILGWAMKSGESASAMCNVTGGWVVFPHAGKRARLMQERGEVAVQVIEGALIIDGRQLAPEEIEAVPSVVVGDARIFLDRSDPCYETWIDEQPFSKGLNKLAVAADDHERWRSAAASASIVLQGVWPEFLAAMLPNISTIVPIHGLDDGDSLSSSSGKRVGAVLASVVPGVEFAEMLVHEYGHNLLYALMSRDEYVLPSDGEHFYSPFRPDPRPLRGMLHALFSFVLVGEYYRRMCFARPMSSGYAERYSVVVVKVAVCIASIGDESSLFAAGKVLVERAFSTLQYFEGLEFFCPEACQVVAEISALDRFCSSVAQTGDAVAPEGLARVRKTLNGYRDLAKRRGIKRESVAIARGLVAKCEPLGFSRRRASVPAVLSGVPLFDAPQSQSIKDFILSEFGNQTVQQIDLSRHYGLSSTPRRQATLHEHFNSPSGLPAMGHPYLAVQPMGAWPRVKSLLSNLSTAILRDFWLDNNELLLFANKKGTVVRMHYDSANNVHFNLSGRKTFCLLPPGNGDALGEGEDGYGPGFSGMNPFDTDPSHVAPGLLAGAAFVTLEPNDCLYVPKDWWHAVHYLEDCISVTCFDSYQPLFM